MHVLIVEIDPDRAALWSRSLARQGAIVTRARTETEAITAIGMHPFDVIVMNIELGNGKAMAIGEYAAFRLPKARIIVVSGSTFFSDGSIFSHMENAHACIPDMTAPEDLAALVEFHGRAISATG